MSSLGEAIRNKALAEGIAIGKAEGKAEGNAEGSAKVFAAFRFVQDKIFAGHSQDDACAEVQAECHLSEEETKELKDIVSGFLSVIAPPHA